MFSPQSILRTLLKSPNKLTPFGPGLGLESTFLYQTFTPTPNPKPSSSGLIFTTALTFTSRSGPMGSSSGSAGGEPNRDPGSNPRVARLRELIASGDYPDGWERSWEEEITPWDLGRPTPIVVQLLRAQSLPKGRVLVPGCGTGYDVIALAGPERYVVGLDISSTAIKKANELAALCPNKHYFSFLAEDFFTWNPSEPFDLIFDYVFFCALEPTMRSAWAKKISEILKPEGELITLIYVITGQKDGPPFNNDVADYEDVLYPSGFKQISIEDNKLAVGPRKGREKLVRWKRNTSQSNL